MKNTKNTKNKLVDPVKTLDNNLLDVNYIEGVNTCSGVQDDSLALKLIEAKLANLEARTQSTIINSRNTKRQLYAMWTTDFMNLFQESFKTYKNRLVELHLGKEQTDLLNELIEQSMQKLSEELKKLLQKDNVIDKQEVGDI